VTLVDGVYTFTDNSGATLAVIDTNADAIAYDNATSGLTANDVQSALDEIAGLVGAVDLVDNGDGTFTYTDADGVALTFDANTVTVTVTDGVYTFVDGAGATITTIDTNADAIA